VWGCKQAFSHSTARISFRPVKAELVKSAEYWPYCYGYVAKKKAQGLKP
jgi:hypothetical protein